ncbi:MAG: hypothetical protein KC464_07670, partial [Myxococcales bacterium]|nr:hypothetical protein [Myxococcales bacterium]
AEPLLAWRPHGAGRVLAWTADLGGAWVPPDLGAALIRDVAVPRAGVELEVAAATTPTAPSAPSAIDVTVASPDGVAVGQLDVRSPDRPGETGRTVALIARGFDHLGAVVRVVPSDTDLELVAAGARTTIVLGDPEHAALGPAIWSTPSTPPVSRRERVIHSLPVAATVLAMLALITLAIPTLGSRRIP